MALRIAIPDLVSPSYFPAIAAVELGLFRKEGLDATLELIYPVTKTYEELREGRLDFVGGAAHAALYAFKDWHGGKLVCALARHMYWFLVLRADVGAKRGELHKIKGLRIGAAPGPVDGLRQMLRDAGIDPERDVQIGPVPVPIGAGVSFGVTAAKALEAGQIDGFWANGMGAAVAVRSRVGTLVVDARRGDGPPAALDYTFPALVTTQKEDRRGPTDRRGRRARDRRRAGRPQGRPGARDRDRQEALSGGRSGSDRRTHPARRAVLRSGDQRGHGRGDERLRSRHRDPV